MSLFSGLADLIGLVLGAPPVVQKPSREERERTAALRARRTPEVVSGLAENEVFVFGSNASGQHSGGAARVAHERFGAEWGVGHGPTGRSYAIDTMSGFDAMLEDIVAFQEYAAAHPETVFLLTPIGTGIAGHRAESIAPFFQGATPNVILPQVFVDAIDLQGS